MDILGIWRQRKNYLSHYFPCLFSKILIQTEDSCSKPTENQNVPKLRTSSRIEIILTGSRNEMFVGVPSM